MNKKLLTIFLSLFLVGILSVSCSNKDKTDPKGIEQYNGNTYVSTSAVISGQYLWLSIKDSKVRISASDQTSEPTYQGNMDATGSGTDYKFDSGDGNVAGTLKFSSDGSQVTVHFTVNKPVSSVVGTDIVCNIKK